MRRSPGLCLAHHTFAPLIQNICSGLKSRPGSCGSSRPWRDSHDSAEITQVRRLHKFIVLVLTVCFVRCFDAAVVRDVLAERVDAVDGDVAEVRVGVLPVLGHHALGLVQVAANTIVTSLLSKYS